MISQDLNADYVVGLLSGYEVARRAANLVGVPLIVDEIVLVEVGCIDVVISKRTSLSTNKTGRLMPTGWYEHVTLNIADPDFESRFLDAIYGLILRKARVRRNKSDR